MRKRTLPKYYFCRVKFILVIHLIRNSTYFLCKTIFFFFDVDEPGMFIGLIKDGDALREFNGYLDKEESKRKIIQDVFVKGDKAFLTGELYLITDKRLISSCKTSFVQSNVRSNKSLYHQRFSLKIISTFWNSFFR